MSLYYLQKFIYRLNREMQLQARFRTDRAGALDGYDLTGDEREAVVGGDVGLLYVMGVNGQLLMHFAAFEGLAWPAYIEAMRAGVRLHGPVRAGIYAMTSQDHERVAGV